MTLRTARRRISPRTRKRYRAIKDFFKRAIGSSQTDIEINSSIAVNVTNLNRKILGLEQQLSEVSRTCQEFINLESSRRESQSIVASEQEHDIRDDVTSRDSHGLETRILYQTPETQYRKSEGSDCTTKHSTEISDVSKNNKIRYHNINEKMKISKVEKRINDILTPNSNYKSASDNVVPSRSTNLVYKRTSNRKQQLNNHDREDSHVEQLKRNIPNYQQCEERAGRHRKTRTDKHAGGVLDQDFIADIIKKQYKPSKLFGKRDTNLSQFSEPICRDPEFSINENIQEDPELCSCCYKCRHKPQPNANSVCDTRLYSSKQLPRLKSRRARADAYNDSELYDLIPVKEKSSPKTRRKFFQDNMANYHTYREVLPSPRTHRPRLNLKAQYSVESENNAGFARLTHKSKSPKRKYRQDVPTNSLDSYELSQMTNAKNNKNQKPIISTRESVHQDMGTMSSLQYPQHFGNSTPLNKTQETISSVDKTDRALCEIKDILQTFLQEIKKETSSSGKSDVSNKITESNPNQQANTMPNSSYHFNKNSTLQSSSAPAPIIPTFTNPCCYPILPMYPMNCFQNGYVMPSRSYSCNCASKAEDTADIRSKTKIDESFPNETDELIKEIYKFVAQSPTFSRKQDNNIERENEPSSSRRSNLLTSRSGGGSNQVTKRDAMVGRRIKCYSKSCEAIGSRITQNPSSSETTSSETLIESHDLEATVTSSETDLSTEPLEIDKAKKTKIVKVLQTLGLTKKKKEIREHFSESTIEVNKKNKNSAFRNDESPFQQNITNYMMHGQEYYRSPPIPRDYTERRPYNNYGEGSDPRDYGDRSGRCVYAEASDPRAYAERPGRSDYAEHYQKNYQPPFRTSMPPTDDPYYDPQRHQRYDLPPSNYHPKHASAPPAHCAPGYTSYSQMQSQVPLCLKEVEVKSMATQSERKMSFFSKIKQKIQPIESTYDGPRTFATQTSQNQRLWNTQTSEKSSLWKTWQEKAQQDKQDPRAYSFMQQQKLAAGDTNMRNAMIKKIFHKRNPFSSRNLIMKTLLGKDKISYGSPPAAVYRPRMFF